eukprot:Skav210346  [mRNA]  locus=scaffold4443:156260:159535:- [translate_table: standard]
MAIWLRWHCPSVGYRADPWLSGGGLNTLSSLRQGSLVPVMQSELLRVNFLSQSWADVGGYGDAEIHVSFQDGQASLQPHAPKPVLLLHQANLVPRYFAHARTHAHPSASSGTLLECKPGCFTTEKKIGFVAPCAVRFANSPCNAVHFLLALRRLSLLDFKGRSSTACLVNVGCGQIVLLRLTLKELDWEISTRTKRLEMASVASGHQLMDLKLAAEALEGRSHEKSHVQRLPRYCQARTKVMKKKVRREPVAPVGGFGQRMPLQMRHVGCRLRTGRYFDVLER